MARGQELMLCRAFSGALLHEAGLGIGLLTRREGAGGFQSGRQAQGAKS